MQLPYEFTRILNLQMNLKRENHNIFSHAQKAKRTRQRGIIIQTLVVGCVRIFILIISCGTNGLQLFCLLVIIYERP